jgi:hypothetical protein
MSLSPTGTTGQDSNAGDLFSHRTLVDMAIQHYGTTTGNGSRAESVEMDKNPAKSSTAAVKRSKDHTSGKQLALKEQDGHRSSKRPKLSNNRSIDDGTTTLSERGCGSATTGKKQDLEKRREASRVSSRRTRERERLKLDHMRGCSDQLETQNKNLRDENQQFREIIRKIKEVRQLLPQQQSGLTSNGTSSAGTGQVLLLLNQQQSTSSLPWDIASLVGGQNPSQLGLVSNQQGTAAAATARLPPKPEDNLLFLRSLLPSVLLAGGLPPSSSVPMSAPRLLQQSPLATGDLIKALQALGQMQQEQQQPHPSAPAQNEFLAALLLQSAAGLR